MLFVQEQQVQLGPFVRGNIFGHEPVLAAKEYGLRVVGKVFWAKRAHAFFFNLFEQVPVCRTVSDRIGIYKFLRACHCHDYTKEYALPTGEGGNIQGA